MGIDIDRVCSVIQCKIPIRVLSTRAVDRNLVPFPLRGPNKGDQPVDRNVHIEGVLCLYHVAHSMDVHPAASILVKTVILMTENQGQLLRKSHINKVTMIDHHRYNKVVVDQGIAVDDEVLLKSNQNTSATKST